jgi:hypothetical protein
MLSHHSFPLILRTFPCTRLCVLGTFLYLGSTLYTQNDHHYSHYHLTIPTCWLSWSLHVLYVFCSHLCYHLLRNAVFVFIIWVIALSAMAIKQNQWDQEIKRDQNTRFLIFFSSSSSLMARAHTIKLWRRGVSGVRTRPRHIIYNIHTNWAKLTG